MDNLAWYLAEAAAMDARAYVRNTLGDTGAGLCARTGWSLPSRLEAMLAGLLGLLAV